MVPSAIGGYVLAGGRSTRMGRNKALLELAGKPLIAHAVAKLHRLCTGVHILGADAALAPYAPLVRDLHPGCGPLGGIEAALEHSSCDWSLILPVDVPFLPAPFLERWARSILREPDARASFFTVAGIPNPAVLMIHRDLKPSVARAIASAEFKLLPALHAGCRDLAKQRSLPPDSVIRILPLEDSSLWSPTEAQKASQSLWFANLNTPEDFAEAERHTAANGI